MQIGARGIDLAHALLHGRPGITQLLGHVSKRTGQPAQLVFALQCGFGSQIALGHLAHALCQYQQRFGKLVAQNHCQQHCAEHRQKQTERERAYIHLAQAATRQRPFLVFTVGLLNGNGVGYYRRRNDLCDLQKTRLAQQANIGTVDHRNRLDACGHGYTRHHGDAAGQLASACKHHFVEPFNLRDHALHPGISQLLGRRALGIEDKPRCTDAGNHLARRRPQHYVAGRQLVAHALNCHAGHGIRGF